MNQFKFSLKNSLPYLIGIVCLLVGCKPTAWNNPYPEFQSEESIYYDSFRERPKYLDPAKSYSSNEYVFLGQIYEPPLQYHFLKRPYELVPLTATARPQATYYDAAGNQLDEGAPPAQIATVKYRISIKPGISYQPHPAFAKNAQGDYRYHALTPSDLTAIHVLSDFNATGSREMRAEDYVYQIKRMAHPKVHSPIFGLMGKYILGLNELAQELSDYAKENPDVRYIDLNDFDLPGAMVIDDYCFEITLKQKYPQFLYWLSMSFFSPMPWEAIYFYAQAGMQEKNISLDWYPVGTGPFMLVENNPNLRMVLQRNPHFRGESYPSDGETTDQALGFLDDADQTMPFIDKAIYSLEKESIPFWNKFLQGYYDVSGISSDSFDQAVQFNITGDAELTEEMQRRGIRLLTAVTTSTAYLGFNMVDPIIGGDSERARLLRRAISIAVDYEEYVAIFANGRGMPGQGPIPPGIFGHVKGRAGINPYVYQWQNGQAVRRDIEQARQLMAQAGYPNGRDRQTGQALVLNLDTLASGPDSKAVFDWFYKQFDKLGINLIVRATDYNRFQEKMRNGTAQLYQWGWNADYPDPENFLFLLYGANAKQQHNGENASNYNNAEFDQLFNQMKSMDNSPARQAIIAKMVAIAQYDAPWLWGFHPVSFALHHAWYHNAKPNLMANNTLKYKRIEPELRKQQRQQWNQPIWWPLMLVLAFLLCVLLPAWLFYRAQQNRSIR